MASPANASRAGKAVKWVLFLLGGLAVLAILLHLVFLGFAISRERSVEKRWAEAKMPLAGFLKSLPTAEKNPAAKRLEELVIKLGFSVTPQVEPQPKVTGEWDKIKVPLQEANLKALEDPSAAAGLPPEAVVAYLDSHEADFAAIRAHLLAEKIVWSSHPEKGYAATLPNLLGQIDLARALTAHALLCHARNQDLVAISDLDALWKLADSLRGNPILISQLVAMAEENLALVTMRKLDGAPATWAEQIAASDPTRAMVQAWHYEAACAFGARWTTREGIVGDAGTKTDRLLSAYASPYLRYCAADMTDRFLDYVQNLRASGPWASNEDLQRFAAQAEKGIPKWNIVARWSWVNIGSSWARVKHQKLQAELTKKVLDVKALKAQSGEWPAAVPGIEKSFWPGETWTYEAANGGFSLKFNGPPISKDLVKHQFPMEYKQPGSEEARR